MNVKSISEIINTKRDVNGVGFRSLRIVLAGDGMGFSIHKTIIPKGGPYRWHYKNHLESCYCISGHGVITDTLTGEKRLIMPDTCYSLDKNDPHEFEAIEDTVLISIFNPAITGNEVHDKDGSYATSNHKRCLAKEIVEAVIKTNNDFDAIESVMKLLNKN